MTGGHSVRNYFNSTPSVPVLTGRLFSGSSQETWDTLSQDQEYQSICQGRYIFSTAAQKHSAAHFQGLRRNSLRRSDGVVFDEEKHLPAIGPSSNLDWTPSHRTCCPSGCALHCSQHSQRLLSSPAEGALPLKGRGSYSLLCLSIPRWSFKRAQRERERGETAEMEIVWRLKPLGRSQSIQPINTNNI